MPLPPFFVFSTTPPGMGGKMHPNKMIRTPRGGRLPFPRGLLQSGKIRPQLWAANPPENHRKSEPPPKREGDSAFSFRWGFDGFYIIG